jgi:hypothetical protein
MKKFCGLCDDDLHQDLNELAIQKRTTVAALVRYALDKTFEDDLDVVAARRGIEEVAREPGSTMTLEEYIEQRLAGSGTNE